jgi:peptide/nickel transport system permease protein
VRFLRGFSGNRAAVAGVMFLLALVLAAALAPVYAPDGPWALANQPLLEPFVTAEAPLGTDSLGRDTLAGILFGARISLTVGLVSAATATLIGIVVGAIAGYYRGVADDVLMRLTEFFQTIPTMIFSIILVAILRPSIVSIINAIAVVSWPPVARLVRGQFLTLRSREFVEAAIVSGQPAHVIMLREILPNAIAPVIVLASLMVGSAILLESAISFLGLGDPNRMSWGYMVGASRDVIRIAWWNSAFPGFVIALTVLAINLVGDGLNDALNPRSNVQV